jgi:Arc/MetJ-type ribon-helix-helix transcriptional regulator
MDGKKEVTRMSNETEKLTINLGVVELAQVDVLVEQGIYSNRSDFMRTATRKHLELYKGKIESSLIPISSKRDVIGILKFSKKDLEKLTRENEKINVSVIGMLVIDTDVSVELFENTVESIALQGKLIASKEIEMIIKQMN